MEVDFFKDLETEIKEKLKGFGYPIPSFEELRKQHISATEAHLSYKHYDIKNLVLHFLTVTERRIPIKKWNIHISPQLKNRTEIVNLVTMLSKGEDVNPFLSKQVKGQHQNKKTDLLRFEWGIYHIHFEEGGKGDEMLFVYFDGNKAYLLDILLHEKNGAHHITWTNTDLIQILHDNWPHVISHMIFKTDNEEIVSQEERKTMRKKAANTSVTVADGTEYMPIGGGFTSSKHTQKAAINTLRMIRRTEELELIVLNNEHNINSRLLFNESNTNLNVKLELTDGLNLKVINTANKRSFEFDEPY
ncbi:hypothetical protein [Shewanella scandinavica]|uniref:hypothetical protein n=1 Tax=Shewanella scandinavica TaxID=3063538 RepID=UPI003197A970